MSEGIQTLIVGVLGILATLSASALGFYYTAKARTAPLRHRLYEKQLDLIVEIMQLIGRARLLSIMAANPSDKNFDRAHTDLAKLIPILSKMSDTGAALLPTEIFVEVARILNALTRFSTDIDDGDIDNKFPEELTAHSAKLGLLVRSSLGIDELSEESLKLFGDHRQFERLAKISPGDLLS